MAAGLQGREACGDIGNAAFSLTLMVGKDAPTPDCPTAGCKTPTVSGDGLMPYGSFGGGPYSLGDTGRVIGGPNTEELFVSLFENRVGTANTAVTTTIGYFSKKILYTFPASNIRLQVYESSYGRHSLMGTRMDFSSAFRVFESLSTFERDATGKVVYKAPSHITGTY